MIPILFPYDAVSFTTHGLGDLTETISCISDLHADGEYELTLTYPADGKYVRHLVIDNLIYAKVDDHGSFQAFRIYGIEKEINRTITVHAQHLSYDLADTPVDIFKATRCSEAINKMVQQKVNIAPFRFHFDTDVTGEAQNIDHEFKLEEPKAMRSVLLDGDESIKGTFGGDLIFDNWNVSLKKVGGADRGVLVEYGIDLIDLNQEENISETITGVYPFWRGRIYKDEESYDDGELSPDSEDDTDDDDDLIVVGEPQYASGTFKRQHVIPLNVTEYFPNNEYPPSPTEIENIAREWIRANKIGEPHISLTLSYADLKKDVRIHDAITVRFVKIGISTTAKVVSYRYDTLKERCIQVTVDNAKPSILFDLEDASRLKRGLIPPKRIQNKSITSEKIATQAIGADQIDIQAIQPQHLEPESIESMQLSQGVQQSLLAADLFDSATLQDTTNFPEYFTAENLRIADEEGNILAAMTPEGISAENYQLYDNGDLMSSYSPEGLNYYDNGDLASAYSSDGLNFYDSNGVPVSSIAPSGVNANNIAAGNNVSGKWVIASEGMESPQYLFPSSEGEGARSVNIHTHEISADENGKVTLGKPDFSGASHFFNIADTKFYKDHVSALTITRITHDSAVNVTYNSTTKNLSGYFVLKAMHDDTLIKEFEDQQFLIPASLAYEAGKADGSGSITSITHTTASNVTYNSTTKNLSGYFTLNIMADDELVKSFEGQQFLIPASLAYEAGQSDGIDSIDRLSHTSASNVSYNSTTKNLSGDFTIYLYVGDKLVKTINDQQFLIPGTLAYEAGAQSGDGSISITRMSHSSASNVSYNSTTKNLSGDFTVYIYDGDTLLKAFNDQQFLLPASSAYESGKTDGQASITRVSSSSASNVTYNSNTRNLTGYYTLYLYAGTQLIKTLEDQSFIMPGTLAYEDGAQSSGSTTVTNVTHNTASNVTYNSSTQNISGYFTLQVKSGNNILATFEDQQFLIPASLAYEAGQNSVPSPSYTLGNSNTIRIANYPYGNDNYKAQMRATFTVDGISRNYTDEVNVQSIYDSGVTYGQQHAPAPNYNITDGNVEEDQYDQYDPSDNTAVMNVVASFKVDGINRNFSSWVNVQKVYDAGYDTGVNHVTRDSNDGTVSPNFFDYFTPCMYFERDIMYWDSAGQEYHTVGYITGGVIRKSDNHFFVTNGRALVILVGQFQSGYMY